MDRPPLITKTRTQYPAEDVALSQRDADVKWYKEQGYKKVEEKM